MKDMTKRAERLAIAIEKIEWQISQMKVGKRFFGLLSDKASEEALLQKHIKHAEYMRSVENLARYGVETIPTGNPIGVNIGVPLAGRDN